MSLFNTHTRRSFPEEYGQRKAKSLIDHTVLLYISSTLETEINKETGKSILVYEERREAKEGYNDVKESKVRTRHSDKAFVILATSGGKKKKKRENEEDEEKKRRKEKTGGSEWTQMKKKRW